MDSFSDPGMLRTCCPTLSVRHMNSTAHATGTNCKIQGVELIKYTRLRGLCHGRDVWPLGVHAFGSQHSLSESYRIAVDPERLFESEGSCSDASNSEPTGVQNTR